MTVKSKLDKPFGPSAGFMGTVIFVAGLAAIFYSPAAVVLVALGAFIGFTYTGSELDVQNKRIRLITYYLGFLPQGKWVSINSTMKLGLKKVHRGYRAYSRSNRKLNIHTNDFRVMLLSAKKKPIMYISKHNALEDARKELLRLSEELGVEVNR